MDNHFSESLQKGLDQIEIIVFHSLVVCSAIDCLMETFVCPFTAIKIRLQAQSKCSDTHRILRFTPNTGTYQAFKIIITNEGFKSLYSGFLVGCNERTLYYAFRLSTLNYIEELSRSQSVSGNLKIYLKNSSLQIFLNTTTDMLSMGLSQPFRSIRIRFQCNSNKNTIGQEFAKIYKCEGLKGYWRGLTPCLCHSFITNSTDIIFYENLKKIFSDKPNHSSRLMVIGFSTILCVIFSNPLDVIKSRMISAEPLEYKNIRDCAAKIYRQNGIRIFYIGFLPYFYSSLIRELIMKYLLDI